MNVPEIQALGPRRGFIFHAEDVFADIRPELLVISVAALWLFGGVTEDVIHHDPLTQFDVTLLEWLQAHTTTSGMQIFAAISSLGSPLVMTALGLAVALALAVRRFWLVLVGWAGLIGGAGVLDALLKHIIRRPRPIYASAFLHSYSFPSGHAMRRRHLIVMASNRRIDGLPKYGGAL